MISALPAWTGRRLRNLPPGTFWCGRTWVPWWGWWLTGWRRGSALSVSAPSARRWTSSSLLGTCRGNCDHMWTVALFSGVLVNVFMPSAGMVSGITLTNMSLFANVLCVDHIFITLTDFLLFNLGVWACVCACVCTNHSNRFNQQSCAGLYLEWHLEGWCGGNVCVLWACTCSSSVCVLLRVLLHALQGLPRQLIKWNSRRPSV